MPGITNSRQLSDDTTLPIGSTFGRRSRQHPLQLPLLPSQQRQTKPIPKMKVQVPACMISGSTTQGKSDALSEPTLYPAGCPGRLVEEDVRRREAEGKRSWVFALNKIGTCLPVPALSHAQLKHLRITASTLRSRRARAKTVALY
ncbi:hypothetical protein EDB85DRAFT_2292836 [Lactarius pseudohatsudake]|nr:hypothetical protein EDB85DRAFT_2292836 [Lactarius pseudohatsudake]